MQEGLKDQDAYAATKPLLEPQQDSKQLTKSHDSKNLYLFQLEQITIILPSTT